MIAAMNGTAIVKRFSSASALARDLNLPARTVQSWADKNIIPSKWIPRVHAAGQTLDPPLFYADFFVEEEPHAAPQEERAGRHAAAD